MRDRLLPRQRSAVHLAGPHMREGGVQRRLGHADGECAHAGPEQVQGMHGDGEPAIHVTQHRLRTPTYTPSKTRRPIGCGESMSSGSPDSPSLPPGTANAVTPLARVPGVVRANTE